MKKIATYFFVSLGVIFFLLILSGIFLYTFDPFNLKPLFFGGTASESTTDKNPLLSPAQEKALRTIGIDPTSIPSSFTPEQEACFVRILGESRVAEIKAGSTPTPAEYFQAKSCL